jgi:STAM-binding protein
MAQDYEYNQLIPLRYWLRTARSLIKEAEIYEREGHDEKAYLLLFRHAQLVLVHLVNHPDAKDEPNRKPLLQAEREVKVTLQKLEVLKPRINRQYDQYMQLMYERGSWELVSSSQRNDSLTAQGHRPADHALVGVAQPLEAGENRELAVKLARKEISRRASARRAIHAGISREEAHTRRAAGVWGHWEEKLNKDKPAVADDLTRRIQQVRMNIDQAQTENRRRSLGEQSSERLAPREGLSQSSAPVYRYPTVPQQRPFEATIPSPVLPQKIIIKPPERPPKEPRPPSKLAMLDEPPPRPSKASAVSPSPSEASSSENSVTPSDLDPSTFTFKPSAYLENGTPLRTVFLPPNLRSRFLAIASPNTRRNLETCGILCGTLISNALFISKLLIPEQESTSDTCETMNESAIFDYCDSEDLMVLGWIHTHPSQTCFMSSRDLHTQCGYQAMLPESIAIVCAPSKDPDWGVFRLTDPPGLKVVSNCTQTGLFHPHTVSNLYTDGLRPGHVFEAQGLEFETVDLRPGI